MQKGTNWPENGKTELGHSRPKILLVPLFWGAEAYILRPVKKEKAAFSNRSTFD